MRSYKIFKTTEKNITQDKKLNISTITGIEATGVGETTQEANELSGLDRSEKVNEMPATISTKPNELRATVS